MPGRKKKSTKKDTKYVWSEQLEYALIDLYEANNFLYDHTAAEFKNKDLKAATLDTFDKKLGVPEGASKAHIETIRTRYGRDKKEFLQPRSGSARKEPPEVERVFMRRMSFLYKHITPRPTRNSLYSKKLVVKFKWPERRIKKEILQVTDENAGSGDVGCLDQGTSSKDVVVGVWTESSGDNDPSTQVLAGTEEIDPNILKNVEIEIGEGKQWHGDESEPVDNIGELEVPSEEERETLEAAMILNEIDKNIVPASGEKPDGSILKTVDATPEPSEKDISTNNVTGVEATGRDETDMEVDIQETTETEIDETLQSKTTDPPSLQTPTKTSTDSQDIDSVSSFLKVVPKPSTSGAFNALDYIPKDCVPPRSPTPPPPRKRPFIPPVKKGVGKSTIKSPVNELSASGSKKSEKETSDNISGQLEAERLNVLRNLGNSLILESKEDQDRDYHWTKSLLGQAKSVENKILKEQSIAVCNAIMSHAVIGLKLPAVEAMFPTAPARNIGYSVTLPNPTHMQQYPSVYYTPPAFANPNTANVRPQQPIQTLTNPPQPNISTNPTGVNPSSIGNVQGVGTSGFSKAAAAASVPNSYGPSTNEYPYSLNNSPMKGQPNIYCHTLNTFGAGQQATPNTLEYSQM